MLILIIIAVLLVFLLSVSGVLYVHFQDDKLSLWVGALGIKVPLLGPERDTWDEKKEARRKQKSSQKNSCKRYSRKKQNMDDTSSAKLSEEKDSVVQSISQEKQKDVQHFPKKGPSAKMKKVVDKHPKAKKDFTELIAVILELVKAAFYPSLFVLRHLRITKVSVEMTVGGEDASEIALDYAKTYSVVTNLLGNLASRMTVSVKKIEISSDFVTGESHQDISFRIKLRIGIAILGALGILKNFLVTMIVKQKKQQNDSNLGKPASITNNK